MLRNIGPVELLIVLAIVILVFGVGRVSELGGALGKSIREFRREVRGFGEDTAAEEEDTADTDEAADA
jgi:sec-independent protein translocase protein TatA